MTVNSEPLAVFIHLGKKIPKHFWLNIQRHLDLFPKIGIAVILNSEEEFFNKLEGKIIFYKYTRGEEAHRDFTNLATDQAFRSGFWIYSLERLYALREFHLVYPDAHLMHIESDVTLFENFPYDSFAKIDKLAWCRYNRSMDVAALLFSPSPKTSNWLIERVRAELTLNNNHTDMSVLSVISHSHPSKVLILPSATKRIPEMINANSNLSDKELQEISVNEKYFGGIFDPAAMGMWLMGQDPKNHYGITRFHVTDFILNGDSYVDPSHIEYRLSPEGKLSVAMGEIVTQIFNMHVHSKSITSFGADWQLDLDERIRMTVSGKRNTFEFRVLCALLIDNFRQGSLVRFVAGIPPLYRIRKKVFRK